LILENLKGKILDVGCDHSTLHKSIYNKFGKSVFGIDVNLRVYKNFPQVFKASAESIPFKNNTFDSVVAGELIEHLDNPNLFLNESYRILKKNGHLILTTPNKNSWINKIFKTLESYNRHDLPYEERHKILFTKNSLIKLTSKHFHLRSFTYFVSDENSATDNISKLNKIPFSFSLRRLIHRTLPLGFQEGMFFLFEVKK